MRVVHVSTGTSGGSGRIALLLHQALRKLGVDSQMVVNESSSTEHPFVHRPQGLVQRLLARYLRNIDKLPNKLYRHKLNTAWSNNWAPVYTIRKVLALQPDIVHLHLIGAGVFPIHDFSLLRAPIVWTMHDTMAFTGGCHYPNGCERFRECCGSCPELGSKNMHDLSGRNWRKKETQWRSLPMAIVSPSHWMQSLGRSSSLLHDKRHVVIHNGIDLDCFRPHAPRSAREALGLPKDKKLIGFGASLLQDPRKGLRYLKDALESTVHHFAERGCEVVTFGHGSASEEMAGMRSHNFGSISDDRKLALLYSSLDVFCVPSIEENLATTAIESLACGTPVVAFRIGGFPDIVEHLKCGFLAEPFEPLSLVEGIQWALFANHPSGGVNRIRESARSRAKLLFDSRAVARKHLDLYQILLEEASTQRK
jgi:glycosyltransferase involved in cell wall biosynthesis